jgi:hypothetical protein
MNIGLLSGLAAAGLLMTNAPVWANHDNGDDRTHDYREPEYGPSIRPDHNAYDFSNESSVAFAAPNGSSYSYDGDWQGAYVDPQGRVFEGEWEGRVTRHDGVAGSSYPAPAARHPAAAAPYALPRPQAAYGTAWQGGYYYYPQSAPTVTVISMAPVITTTTTVTEEVYYVTIRSAPRKKAVRKWKPKPTCVCR